MNWLLLLAVLLMILIFRSSNNLTHAYGLAVSGTMLITGIMILWILLLRGSIVKSLVAVVVLTVNLVFLTANLNKIPYGGYISLLIAFIPFCVIMIYVNGQQKALQCPEPGPARHVPAEVQRSV